METGRHRDRHKARMTVCRAHDEAARHPLPDLRQGNSTCSRPPRLPPIDQFREYAIAGGRLTSGKRARDEPRSIVH
jgi:hypothetical protein